MSFFDVLYQFDLRVLEYLNVKHHDPTLDQYWLQITHLHKVYWFQMGVLPALLLIGLFLCRWEIIKVLIALAISVSASDMIAYRFIKQIVQRSRPFDNPEIKDWLRHVGQAHGPSFPSNHAANVFAGAVILAWYFPGARYLFYGFAFLVAVSRPILGVHYPSDVLAGALLGYFVGTLVIAFILNRISWFWIKRRVSRGDDFSGNWRKRFDH